MTYYIAPPSDPFAEVDPKPTADDKIVFLSLYTGATLFAVYTERLEDTCVDLGAHLTVISETQAKRYKTKYGVNSTMR